MDIPSGSEGKFMGLVCTVKNPALSRSCHFVLTIRWNTHNWIPILQVNGDV